jgi:hypothetical protein
LLLLASKAFRRPPNPPYPGEATHDEGDGEAADEIRVDPGFAVADAEERPPPDVRLLTTIAAAAARIAIATARYLQP